MQGLKGLGEQVFKQIGCAMGLSYKKAGVDIERANALVASMKTIGQKTRRAEVLKGIGGFGAFFELAKSRYKQPILVASCDGVGTKLKMASQVGLHHGVGIDLVAMSANDLLCSGAEPLFFLDYVSTGKLESQVLKEVISSIVKGCQAAGCALVGGETAEMPGMYKKGEYDLAGFCVGVVEKRRILGQARVEAGDAVIGLESSGLHSNGFSLVRKIFSKEELKERAAELLKATRIYVKPVLKALQKFNARDFRIKAAAHITGGGFYDKAARIVPANRTMVIYRNAWHPHPLFIEMQRRGRIKEKEMFRTFNMGIGMVLVVRDRFKMDVIRQLAKAGVRSYIVGDIVSGIGGVEIV